MAKVSVNKGLLIGVVAVAIVSITKPADTRPAPAQTAGERSSAGSDSARAAVATYLDAVDHIQPGKMSGDAEGVANEMAAALARGDTSDLDRMIRETEAAKKSLAALTPLASCASHHRESLGSLDDALEMLRSLKTAMESPDPAASSTSKITRHFPTRNRHDRRPTSWRAHAGRGCSASVKSFCSMRQACAVGTPRIERMKRSERVTQ